MTEDDQDRSLQYADTTVDVDGVPVPGRLAFVPASQHFIGDRWVLLLFGTDFSASITLDGLTPEELVLTVQNDDTGFTDLRTAVAHHPGKGPERP